MTVRLPHDALRLWGLILCLVLARTCVGDGALAYGQDAAHPAVPLDVPAELTLPDTRLELRRGIAAPYDGILFDAPTLVRWTQRIEWLSSRLRLEHELHAGLEATATASYREHLERLSASYERELEGQRRLLETTQTTLEQALTRNTELERRSPRRAFGVGFGLGAGLVLASAVAGAWLGR